VIRYSDDLRPDETSAFSARRIATLNVNGRWLRKDGTTIALPTDPRQRERVLDRERALDREAP
jgi:hypothetical protein